MRRSERAEYIDEEVLRVHADVIEPLRDAVAAMRSRGVVSASLKEEIRKAIRHWTGRLQDEHNEGRPFPPFAGRLPAGRRPRAPMPGDPPSGEG